MKEEFIFIDGKPYKPVVIPANGQFQLMQIARLGLYVLVHPNGRQAWFHEDQMKESSLKVSGFHYTADPMRDLKKLIDRGGLRPFWVDPDFDPGALADMRLN